MLTVYVVEIYSRAKAILERRVFRVYAVGDAWGMAQIKSLRGTTYRVQPTFFDETKQVEPTEISGSKA